MTESTFPTPDDWQDISLGDLLTFSNGINADKSVYGSGVPFANVLEVITYESLRAQDIPGRIELPRKILQRYEVRRGDILFNRTSETQDEVGISSVYLADEPIVFGGFVFRGRPVTDAMAVNYSKYALRAAYVRDQIISRGQGGIRANIGQRDLKSVVLRIPSLKEQRAIAEVLDDAASQLKTLEHLIEKKQAIKQGMMQQLLTGKARLPGFSARWQQVRLGDHVSYLKVVPLSRAQLDADSPLRYLHYGDIHTRAGVLVDTSQEQMPRAPVSLARDADRLKVGDLVFVDASEDLVGVGKSVEITATPREGVVAGLHTIAARFDKTVLADGFKAYLQFIPDFRDALLRLAAGTKVLATNRSHISSITLRIPGIDEQEAIATVLRDCDRELDALGQRLHKARAIKQGMMQELLIGRIRLPVNEVAL
ncbi:restriction endonuclease subunit S [Mycolicibacterium sp. ND9-15]|uniref:restriction endonuclease subunit S n=1 Tax=Mycolicibacterium sp. ND9-15 TaxID=3042320 RepID=UPI002DDA5DAC|nr:restriction endonuclease subunit S [Mycolicibacterium sp. ND9-15]WSE57017.1 restriction endonuclease subunit S [Mycolicibacterium sp. ND9-15]